MQYNTMQYNNLLLLTKEYVLWGVGWGTWDLIYYSSHISSLTIFCYKLKKKALSSRFIQWFPLHQLFRPLEDF